MSPLIADIPETNADLARWLEEVLVAGKMPQLAAELKAVRAAGAAPPFDWRRDLPMQAVYNQGFSVLPEAQLRSLLVHPAALVELSGNVFEKGGPFWAERFRGQPAMAQRAAKSLRLLRQAIDASGAGQGTREAPMPLREPALGRRWYSAPWLVGPLTAAAVLAAVVFIPALHDRLAGPAPQGVDLAARWGWLKADELPANLAAADYLDRLAELAGEWRQQRPETAEALARRLTEWRLGCANLQLRNHPQLGPQANKWLVEKCQKWARDIDAQLVQLETTHDVDKVRTEADAIADRAVKALRGEVGRLRGQAV